MSAHAALLDDDSQEDERTVSGSSTRTRSSSRSPAVAAKGQQLHSALETLSLDSGSSSSSGIAPHAPAASSLSGAPGVALAARAPFRPAKVLGPDVVVLRHLSKRYALAGRSGGAAGAGEEVVALRHVNLIPLGEEPEADAAEEAAAANAGRSLGAVPRSLAHSSSHMHPIRRGEFVMIRGPSGGGKTTLLNILGTIDSATSGSVEMFGEIIDANSSDKKLADLRLQKIGFVFQTFNLLATMSAFENVELPMVIRGKLSRNECKARALELLDMVGLQDRYGHLPSELSGGEQQRVTIARALANEPELLLLDEPTGDLDSRNTVDVMDLILRINLGTLSASVSSTSTSSAPTTVIMVTHNPDLEPYADRILYVEDGAFKKQAINRRQRKIDYEKYLQHINKH